MGASAADSPLTKQVSQEHMRVLSVVMASSHRASFAKCAIMAATRGLHCQVPDSAISWSDKYPRSPSHLEGEGAGGQENQGPLAGVRNNQLQ